MPTATPFTALGKGNGFPFCVNEVDVSSYADWVTLGGTRKGGSPSQGEINLSLENAMKLFWNYNGHSVKFTPQDSEVDIDVESGDYNLKLPTVNDWNSPLSRVCLDAGWLVRDNNTSARESTVDLRGLSRMYSGGNFVGYGISFAFSGIISGFSFSFSSFYPASTLPEVPNVAVKSTTLNGIPFLGIAVGSNISYTASISDQTATFSRSGSTTIEIEYKALDFYTY